MNRRKVPEKSPKRKEVPSDKQKTNILDLQKYLGSRIEVKAGGRECKPKRRRSERRRLKDKDSSSLLKKIVKACLANFSLVTGKLSGFDQLMNLVLEETAERLRGRTG